MIVIENRPVHLLGFSGMRFHFFGQFSTWRVRMNDANAKRVFFKHSLIKIQMNNSVKLSDNLFSYMLNVTILCSR